MMGIGANNMAKNKPKAKIQAGSARCVLWENEIDSGGRKTDVLKVTSESRYWDNAGIWQSS